MSTTHPMIGANQASSYICFVKLKNKFLSETGFKLEKIEFCSNSNSYTLSGGLNFPQIEPFPLIKYTSNLKLFPKILSLHWIIKLRKT